MNNIERMEVVRGPESTIYGTDAMTSVVQMWTTTGTTLKPEFEFGADGGTFSTANGYFSVAGCRQDLRLQLLRQPVRHPGTGHQRRLLERACRAAMSEFASRRAWRFAFACATRTTGRACSRTGGSTAIRCCRPTPTRSRTRTTSWPAPSSPSAAPGAWQHTFSGFEYNHLQANSQAVRRSRPRVPRQPVLQPEQVQPRRLRIPGTMDASPLGANQRRLHLRGRDRHHHFQLRARHRLRIVQLHSRPALQQLSLRAGTPHLEAPRGAGRCGLRQQLQLRQQSRASRFGVVPLVPRQ